MSSRRLERGRRGHRGVGYAMTRELSKYFLFASA